ncbi:beta-lactamase/transpeptidase-like protein [Corynascus novoguineensis]|uniref:Beta-lactamase/transpeptidase-like protein n=1 Tax=Corynascus novoguineensis TaxID=1126955 RepID=A0AAN7CNJ0_9PEZI|nr:beta-lactamase/transpeptidase-like protein [Corynascus novoguineensis]
MGLFRPLVLLGALAGLGLGQDCPIYGPAYPEVDNPGSAAAFTAARAAFETEIKNGLASGQLDNTTSFAVQVFSPHSEKALYEHYHGPSVGPETLFRIASVSKLMSVYTTLIELGDKYWDEPVTKYVPELARLKVQNPVYDVDWSQVTLGDLASHMGGVPRDYALGDLGPFIPDGVPGLPTLNEKVFDLLSRPFPVSASSHTPVYSNMAFQVLSYAVETIARKKFSKLVHKNILKPLKLTRTFLANSINDTNHVVGEAWDWDFGEEAPGGGYFSCAKDLTKLGRAILSSTLLPRATTRRWLRPVAHTARLALSLGRPWEIQRLGLPVSSLPNSPPDLKDPNLVTRPSDLFTKQGSISGYQTLLALSPEHGIGYVVLAGGTAGNPAGDMAAYTFLEEALNRVWLVAAEVTAREQTRVAYAGNYTLAPADDEHTENGGGAEAEFALVEGEPGLRLERFASNGTDVLALLGQLNSLPDASRFRAWLYPAGLAGGNKVAFRRHLGWRGLDTVRYGGNPADLFIFELGKDGKAVAVEVPVLKKTLRRREKLTK